MRHFSRSQDFSIEFAPYKNVVHIQCKLNDATSPLYSIGNAVGYEKANERNNQMTKIEIKRLEILSTETKSHFVTNLCLLNYPVFLKLRLDSRGSTIINRKTKNGSRKERGRIESA